MLHTKRALGGMMVAPHHLAAQAGRDVLREGGNAAEAMVASRSTAPWAMPARWCDTRMAFWKAPATHAATAASRLFKSVATEPVT